METVSICRNTMTENGSGDLERWSAAFEIAMTEIAFCRVLDLVQAEPSNIYTAKLSQTRGFCAAIEADGVTALDEESRKLRLADFLEVLATMTTHSRLAYVSQIRMLGRGCWVSSKDRRAGALPVLSVEHLAALTGRSSRALRTITTLLVRDRALRSVSLGDGAHGFVVMPGYAEEGGSRAVMQRF